MFQAAREPCIFIILFVLAQVTDSKSLVKFPLGHVDFLITLHIFPSHEFLQGEIPIIPFPFSMSDLFCKPTYGPTGCLGCRIMRGTRALFTDPRGSWWVIID